MRRPQGFDRPPAPPAEPPTPAPAREDRAPSPRATDRAPEAESQRSPVGPARSVGTITEPIPIVRSRSEEDEERVAARRVPTDREIGKALRAARRERKRLERGEVRRFTARSRRRRIAGLAAAGVVVALVLGVVFVAYSPLLALKHIDVTGTSRLDAGTIEKKLSDQLGKPLPLLDQAEISSDLAAFPLIRSYTVESHPPDSIVVRVVERRPIGIVKQGSAFVLVDAAKVPIASAAARQDGYPVIAASGAPAESDADSGFAAAAAVLSALPKEVLGQVDTISAKTKDDVSFTLRGRSATVVWGSPEDSSLKAADLAALLKSAPTAGRYDVSSPHSVTTG